MTSTKPAVDYPGQNPGSPKIVFDEAFFCLENSSLKARWNLEEGQLSEFTFEHCETGQIEKFKGHDFSKIFLGNGQMVDLSQFKLKDQKKKDDIVVLAEQQGDVKTQKTFVQKLRQGQADKKSQLKLVAKDLKFYKDHDDCPTCGQSIESAFKHAVVGAKTGAGKKLATEIEEFTKDIDEAVSIINQMEEVSAKLYETRSDASALEREIVRPSLAPNAFAQTLHALRIVRHL